jgi:hypothetical protein
MSEGKVSQFSAAFEAGKRIKTYPREEMRSRTASCCDRFYKRKLRRD